MSKSVKSSGSVAELSGDVEVQIDRRTLAERRQEDQLEGHGTREFKEPRRRKERRRQIDPTTCERDYSSDEIDFMRALDDYKRSSGRMFPTCSEILEVVRSLGYVKLNDDERHILESIEAVEAELQETCHDSPEVQAETPASFS